MRRARNTRKVVARGQRIPRIESVATGPSSSLILFLPTRGRRRALLSAVDRVPLGEFYSAWRRSLSDEPTMAVWSWWVSRVVCNILGSVWPAYASYRAVLSGKPEQHKQ